MSSVQLGWKDDDWKTVSEGFSPLLHILDIIKLAWGGLYISADRETSEATHDGPYKNIHVSLELHIENLILN